MVLAYAGAYDWEAKILSGEKTHTIRKDENNRWAAGNDIQHVVHNRTPNRTQFSKDVCTATQQITIVFDERGKIELVKVDGKRIANWELIAKNDGLSIIDFESFFYGQSLNGIYKGKIIHWSNVRY